MSQRNQPNFYFVLNVSPQADSKEIKRAYLKLAKTYHPDKNHGNKLAEKKFQQINTAWQVLKDPKKRQLFDKNLQSAKKKKQAPSPAPTAPAPSVRKEKAIDLEIPLKVSLEELCQSRSKTIHYFKPVNGTKIKSSFTLQVPLGAWQGHRLRFKHKGGAEGKKTFGDLYVQIQIKPHKIFNLTKNSKDLILEYPISFISAIEGQKLDVPSPYGFLTMDLSPPLRDKQLLKIKGYGLPKKLKEGKGDLFVQILIDYPLKEGVKIQKQMKSMSFDQKKNYVKKIKGSTFIYPKVLKFQKTIQELKRKS